MPISSAIALVIAAMRAVAMQTDGMCTKTGRSDPPGNPRTHPTSTGPAPKRRRQQRPAITRDRLPRPPLRPHPSSEPHRASECTVQFFSGMLHDGGIRSVRSPLRRAPLLATPIPTPLQHRVQGGRPKRPGLLLFLKK
jgi:hypothetical protein